MNFLLTNLADELLVQDITEPSRSRLSFRSRSPNRPRFCARTVALELLIGAHENSEWFNGKLVIDANHGNLHLLQAAFYAVKLEVQRRGVALGC